MKGYGHKGASGAYRGTTGKSNGGGAKAKSPFASRKMPANQSNEVKASHKGHAK